LVVRVKRANLMDPEARPSTDATGDGDVDHSLAAGHTVQGGPGSMAENGVGAEGKYGPHPPPALRRLTDRVDALVNGP
jgi:hypothetical protein